VFGGKNPSYANTFVEKVEKYTVNLNDWSVVKFTVLGDFVYEPTTRSAIIKVSDTEVAILGGKINEEFVKGYYVFDIKKKTNVCEKE